MNSVGGFSVWNFSFFISSLFFFSMLGNVNLISPWLEFRAMQGAVSPTHYGVISSSL